MAEATPREKLLALVDELAEALMLLANPATTVAMTASLVKLRLKDLDENHHLGRELDELERNVDLAVGASHEFKRDLQHVRDLLSRLRAHIATVPDS